MDHQIMFVSDDELSDSQPWAFVVQSDEAVILFIRESAVSPQTLTRAWNSFCALALRQPLVLVA